MATPSGASDPIRIALCMIVKNEEKIIERCLTSLMGLVDTAVICDTGSTDATQTLVRQVLGTKWGPEGFCLFEEPFQDFGYNRTKALERTRAFVTGSLGWPADHVFILTVDADMEVDFTHFDKTALEPTIHSYMIQQYHGGLVYDNRRLLNGAFPWISEGVTHEVNQAQGIEGLPGRLTTLRILDHNDGSSHSVKNVRDETLLRKGLREEPTNVRYMFYLANTLRESGEPEKVRESIVWYEKHRELQHWAEEKWHSLYSIGQAWEQLTKGAGGPEHKRVMWHNALESYLAAYQERPSRAEPLWRVATYLRQADKAVQGYVFAKAASAIPIPTEDILFLEKHLYDYGIDEELSICAFWANRRHCGFKALQRLLRLRSDRGRGDWSMVSQAMYNLQFYEGFHTAVIAPCIRSWRRIPGEHIVDSPLYTLCNPSMVEDRENPGHLLVLCRTVNYDQYNVRRFVSREASGTFRTKNYLVALDPADAELRPRSVRPLAYNEWEGPTHGGTQVHGLEDCRIHYNAEGVLCCSATCLELTADQRPKITRVPLVQYPHRGSCDTPDQYHCQNPPLYAGELNGDPQSAISRDARSQVLSCLSTGGLKPFQRALKRKISFRTSSGPLDSFYVECCLTAGKGLRIDVLQWLHTQWALAPKSKETTLGRAEPGKTAVIAFPAVEIACSISDRPATNDAESLRLQKDILQWLQSVDPSVKQYYGPMKSAASGDNLALVSWLFQTGWAWQDNYCAATIKSLHRWNCKNELEAKISSSSGQTEDVALKNLILEYLEREYPVVFVPEPIPGQDEGGCEKNWLPISGTDRFLYGIQQGSLGAPTRAILIEGSQGPADACRDRTMLDLRGSAGPVCVAGLEGYGGPAHWLVLYHAVCDRDEYRHYYQKFITYSKEWELVGQTDLFCFRKNNVEMGTGMVLMGPSAERPASLYISLGIEDREGWLIELDPLAVLAVCGATPK